MNKNELQSIPIPPDWSLSRGTWSGHPNCICCDTQAKGAMYVRLDDGEHILPPESEGYGWYPIGSGCLKKYPDMKHYARRI